MKIITEQKGKLKGKRILLRLDLNAPIENSPKPMVGQGKIIDNFKIEKIITTIGFLKREGAKIIILSHIGRSGNDSLKPVCEYLKTFFETEFAEDIFSDTAKTTVANMRNGDVLMFENLRKYDGEKNNDLEFAKKLASFGDIFVNDAFAVSHRSHASIVALPKLLDSYFGSLFAREIEELEHISKSASPRLFILGGNKLKTKLPLLKQFLETGQADFIFVGGAMANDFFRAKGFEMGRSLVSDMDFDLATLLGNPKIILPIDVLVESAQGVQSKKPNEVLQDEKIVDVGPEAIDLLKEKIKEAKFILWNGPLGDYPRGFADATLEIIQVLADGKAETIAGGGDTEHCISKLGLEEKFDFISTGGGAMLEFIATGTLAGIEAIEPACRQAGSDL